MSLSGFLCWQGAVTSIYKDAFYHFKYDSITHSNTRYCLPQISWHYLPFKFNCLQCRCLTLPYLLHLQRMVIGTGGQMVSQLAREAAEDLSRVFLREVKLRLSVKLKKWRGWKDLKGEILKRRRGGDWSCWILRWLWDSLKSQTWDKSSSWVKRGAVRWPERPLNADFCILCLHADVIKISM